MQRYKKKKIKKEKKKIMFLKGNNKSHIKRLSEKIVLKKVLQKQHQEVPIISV